MDGEERDGEGVGEVGYDLSKSLKRCTFEGVR